MTDPKAIEMKRRLDADDDPGCSAVGDYQTYTCYESDAVNNACASCLRCTIKAGYRDEAHRRRVVMAPW